MHINMFMYVYHAYTSVASFYKSRSQHRSNPRGVYPVLLRRYTGFPKKRDDRLLRVDTGIHPRWGGFHFHRLEHPEPDLPASEHPTNGPKN